MTYRVAVSPKEPCPTCGKPFFSHDSEGGPNGRYTYTLCDFQEVFSPRLFPASREASAARIRASMLARMTPDELLDARAPDFRRACNYEIEDAMQEEFGDEWIVPERCPFKGEFCKWGSLKNRAR